MKKRRIFERPCTTDPIMKYDTVRSHEVSSKKEYRNMNDRPACLPTSTILMHEDYRRGIASRLRMEGNSSSFHQSTSIAFPTSSMPYVDFAMPRPGTIHRSNREDFSNFVDDYKKRKGIMLSPRRNSSEENRLEMKSHEKYKETKSPAAIGFKPLDPPPFTLRPIQQPSLSGSRPSSLPTHNKGIDDIAVITSNVSHFQSGVLATITKKQNTADSRRYDTHNAAVLLASIRNSKVEKELVSPVSLMPEIPILEKHSKRDYIERQSDQVQEGSDCNNSSSSCISLSSAHVRARAVSMDTHSPIYSSQPSSNLHRVLLKDVMHLNMNNEARNRSGSIAAMSPILSRSLHPPPSQGMTGPTRKPMFVGQTKHKRGENSHITNCHKALGIVYKNTITKNTVTNNATNTEVRAILRKKFSWKHYPELEAFLIENRDEYLRHSALNYTMEQKLYNNRLTGRVIELATSCGYVFDPEMFTFAMIRDRIRCYFKTYVQSCKRRGKVFG